MPNPAGDRQEEQLVLFRLADEYYGLDIGCVREIIVWQPVTRVPRTPPFIEGVINLRGQIIPVIDLRRRFGLPETERDRSSRIVVVEIASVVTGLVVDAVSEVIRLPTSAIEPPSEVLAVDAAFIRGIARTDQRLIILLNAERILDHAEQEALAAGAAAATEAAAAATGDGGGDGDERGTS